MHLDHAQFESVAAPDQYLTHHPSIIMWARRFAASAQTQLANGNLFFAASGVLGATALGMYALDARARAASDDVTALRLEISNERRRQAEEAKKPFVFSDAPEKFQAKVTRKIAPQFFDGPLALKVSQSSQLDDRTFLSKHQLDDRAVLSR